ADLEERIAKRGDVVDELRRQILMHAADAEIGGMQAAAGGALVEPHKLFPLFEAPERRRERADIHSLRGHVEEVRQQPSNLAIEHADELRAPRHRKPEQLFRRQAEGMLLVYRGDLVKPVEIRDRLQRGIVLGQVFGPGVQKADMRIDAFHHLAVELQYETQYAVRRRVLGPEIDGEIAQLRFSHGRSSATQAKCEWGIAERMPSQPLFPLPAFSSPGSR